jgi:hypothetical protein
MSLESKSQELKNVVSTYDTQWFLSGLSGLMIHPATARFPSRRKKIKNNRLSRKRQPFL